MFLLLILGQVKLRLGLPRRGRKGVKIGCQRVRAPRRVPPNFRKEVWIGPRRAINRKKTPTSYFQKKSKIRRDGGGLFCAPRTKQGIIPNIFITIS